jgi:PhzF family phenazine biosynthesis protein
MPATLYLIDAFTDRPFAGNPAAVCLLQEPASEDWMQLVAREMNLSETAFLHPVEGGFSLRWLTPTVEVALCGHATLASAFALWETGVLSHDQAARFFTKSGWLTCHKDGDWIAMDFPARPCATAPPPEGLSGALGCDVLACGSNGMDYLVEVAGETRLRDLQPNFTALARLPVRGVIVTCRSESAEFDFISRFFAPAAGIPEDPVTGSAHCALAPYWQGKLGKSDFSAFQASQRGGVLRVGARGERVRLCGQAVLMGRVDLLR